METLAFRELPGSRVTRETVEVRATRVILVTLAILGLILPSRATLVSKAIRV